MHMGFIRHLGEVMSQRINYIQQCPELFKKYSDFNNAIKAGSLEPSLHILVTTRASQMNGCAFCLDMHVKEARIQGESDLRVHHIAIWRESQLFSERERAALAWTEVLTKIPEDGISDEIFDTVRAQFNEKELSELTFSIMAINGWNRVNVAFRTPPGSADKAFGLDKAGLS